MIKKWSVNAAVTGSKHLGVFEAETADEAIEQAIEANGSVSMCWQCSAECQDPEIGDVTADEVT